MFIRRLDGLTSSLRILSHFHLPSLLYMRPPFNGLAVAVRVRLRHPPPVPKIVMAYGSCSCSCCCCSALAVVAVIYLWHFHSSLIARKIDCFLCGNVSGIVRKRAHGELGTERAGTGCQRLLEWNRLCLRKTLKTQFVCGRGQDQLARHIPAKSSESANGLCRRFFIQFPPPPAAEAAVLVWDLQLP